MGVCDAWSSCSLSLKIAATVCALSAGWMLVKRLRQPSIKSKFQGKRVVITGASAGIGAALAKHFASIGAEVCLVARREESLKLVQEQCKAINPSFVSHVIVADVSEKEECKRIIQSSIEAMGGIDVLLLNAGIGCLVRLDKLPEEELSQVERVMNINYFANAYLSYFALDALKASKGMIIVNSSLAGIGWSPDRTIYSASKHALRGFFNSLRCEVGDLVQVTIVYPGFVLSEIHDRCYGNESVSRNSKFMSAERCAELILQGAAQGARDYPMTWLGSIGYKLNPFLGPLNDRIAIAKAKEGIKHNDKK